MSSKNRTAQLEKRLANIENLVLRIWRYCNLQEKGLTANEQWMHAFEKRVEAELQLYRRYIPNHLRDAIAAVRKEAKKVGLK